MTTLKNATQAPANLENMTPAPIPAPSPRPSGLLAPDADPGYNALSIAPIPPALGTAVDASRQFYRNGVSQLRMLPLQPAANIAVGSQIQTHIENIIENSGSSLGAVFQTNDVPNPVQTILNITGSGVSGGPDGQVNIGNDTDGLLHGYSTAEDDPAFVLLRDDFIGGQASSAIVGELGWSVGGTAGTPFYGNGFAGMPSMCGTFGRLVPSSASENYFLIPGQVSLESGTNAVLEPFLPLFDYPSWEMTWVFGMQRHDVNPSVASPFPTLANTSFYLGLAGAGGIVPSATVVRPLIFVGLRYDRDTTAPSIADSTFKFEAVVNPAATSTSPTINNTQGNVLDTTFQPQEFVTYRFTIRCTLAGQVQMRLLNSAGQDTGFQTLNVPQQSFSGGTASFGNGIVQLIPTTAGATNAVVTANGTKISVSGWVGGTAASAFTVTSPRWNDVSLTWVGSTTLYGSTTSQPAATFSYYPGVYFYSGWGNDSEAAPAQNRNLLIDFFSFIWNPGVNPANALAPNQTLPRFF